MKEQLFDERYQWAENISNMTSIEDDSIPDADLVFDRILQKMGKAEKPRFAYALSIAAALIITLLCSMVLVYLEKWGNNQGNQEMITHGKPQTQPLQKTVPLVIPEPGNEMVSGRPLKKSPKKPAVLPQMKKQLPFIIPPYDSLTYDMSDIEKFRHPRKNGQVPVPNEDILQEIQKQLPLPKH